MDLEPKEWLTERKLVVFIIATLSLYLTLWAFYLIGYFPEAHQHNEKELTTEIGTGEAR